MGLASKTQVVKFIRKGEKGDTGAKGDKGDTGATGDRGPVMRGPQLWASVETGYSFESGAEGESWKDVVVYNGNYYYCKASHTKTETNYPGSSTGDYLWQLGDKVGLVATDLLIASDALVENLTANYLTMKNSAGETVFEAKDGEVTCKTGTFENVTVSGEVNAGSGRIGGLKISGLTLTNEGETDPGACIMLTNGSNYSNSRYVCMGAGQLPAGKTGAVANFSNTYASAKTFSNYTIGVEAKGAGTNIAIYMGGGCISGFAMKNAFVSRSQTLTRDDYNVLCDNSSVCTITLPTMQLYDDGHVIRFKRLGDASIKIAMNYCYTYNGSDTRYSSPVIMYDRGSYITGTNTLNVLDSLMDSFELVWVRDKETTISGVTYYGAWVQYKLPRDW